MSGTGTVFSRGENPLRADKLNTAFSERVSRAGDKMVGSLLLAHDPVVAFEAATKQYVDSRLVVINTVPFQSAALTNTTANRKFADLPPNSVIMFMTLQETSGHAVSFSIGSSAGLSDVMIGADLAANQLLTLPQLSFSTLAFASGQPLFLNSTAWNSAHVDTKIWYAT